MGSCYVKKDFTRAKPVVITAIQSNDLVFEIETCWKEKNLHVSYNDMVTLIDGIKWETLDGC